MAIKLGEETQIFKEMNSTLSSIPLPKCEQYEIRSDKYWECFHRVYTLTLVGRLIHCYQNDISIADML